jgi:hypothetical protein
MCARVARREGMGDRREMVAGGKHKHKHRSDGIKLGAVRRIDHAHALHRRYCSPATPAPALSSSEAAAVRSSWGCPERAPARGEMQRAVLSIWACPEGASEDRLVRRRRKAARGRGEMQQAVRSSCGCPSWASEDRSVRGRRRGVRARGRRG